MPIPQHEQSRLSREHDFQKRVLAALEKAKPPSYLAIINSPLFLWFISALTITIGGAFLSSQQNCMRERDGLVTRYDKLNVELTARRSQIEQLVLNASTAREVVNGLKSIPYVFSELKDRSVYEIQYELIRAEERISAPRFKRTRAYPYESTTNFYVHVSREDAKQFYQIVFGVSPKKLTDQDLSRLKQFVEPLGLSKPASGLIIRGYKLQAVCSPLSIVRHLFTSDSIIAEAVEQESE